MRAALTHLTRLAQRRPATRHLLEDALRERLEPLARLALEVALESGDPIGQVLARLLPGAGSTGFLRGLLDLCDHRPYRDSLPLREVALALNQQVLTRDLEGPDLATAEPNRRVEIARLHHNLGNRLHALGRHSEAVEAARKAIDLRRHLVVDLPGLRFDLALCLENLGIFLSAMEQREKALAATEEAVEILRDFTDRDNAFQRELARGLYNLSCDLGRLGLNAYGPELAYTLRNLGVDLHRVGHLQESLNAAREGLEVLDSLPKLDGEARKLREGLSAEIADYEEQID